MGKTRAAVKERLTKEISYWTTAPSSSGWRSRPAKRERVSTQGRARRRADDLQDRLQRRMAQL